MYFDEKQWKLRKYSKPFPFAEIDSFLKEDVYQELEVRFPKLNEFGNSEHVSQNNVTLKIDYNHLMKGQNTAWKEFGAYFVSKDFFKKMSEFYKEDLKKIYPSVLKKIEKNELKFGISGIDSFDSCDVLLDFQIGINTPVSEKTSNRGPHLDNRKVLYVGLCYFKDPNDPTSGGHYTAYEYQKKKIEELGPRRSVPLEDVKLVDQVEYSANRLAIFINTALSVHGVSDREITSFERKFFVFNAVMRNELYRIRKPLFKRILDKLKRR